MHMFAINTAVDTAEKIMDMKSPKDPLIKPNKWKSNLIFSRLILGCWIATGHYNSVKYVLQENKYKWTKRLAKLWSYIIRSTFPLLIVYIWIETMNSEHASNTDNGSLSTNINVSANNLHMIQLCLWTLMTVLSYLCLFKNIGHYNTNFINHINNLTINNDHIPSKELFIYIFLIIGSVAFINIIPYFDTFCSADDKFTHLWSNMASTWINIISIYVFNITIAYICLLHVTNFKMFVRKLKNNKYNHDMALIKQEYNEMIKNFKYTKKNWEQWISILFTLHMIYLGSTVLLFVLSDYDHVWTWCDQTFPQAVLILIWSAVRCVAILYPPVRLNSSFMRIPKYVFTHIQWYDTENGSCFDYGSFNSNDSINDVMLLEVKPKKSQINKSGIKNNDIEFDTKYLIKSLIKYYDTKRFYDQLIKYPPSLNIIGFRAEWGSFKTVIFLGFSALLTAWVKHAME